jgi:hypothetical protein
MRFFKGRAAKEPDISTGDPRLDAWETVATLEDEKTAVAWRDHLRSAGDEPVGALLVIYGVKSAKSTPGYRVGSSVPDHRRFRRALLPFSVGQRAIFLCPRARFMGPVGLLRN